MDTYVELDYLRQRDINSSYAGELLDKAEEMVRPEIKNLRPRASRSKGYRRLLLSLSEIYIRKSRLVEAERLLTELCSLYEKLTELDIVDRHGHLRTLISLARLSPGFEAETHWSAALDLERRYYPLEEEVFVVALMYLSICVARLQHGNTTGGKSAFDYAANICRTKSPQFLMPGLGTYLFNDLQCQTVLDGISSYVRVIANGKLVGNAFASRWTTQGTTTCWVTQLVVHSEYRERGLASGLLNAVKQDVDDAYGIMSSHPAACLAAAKAFGSKCTVEDAQDLLSSGY